MPRKLLLILPLLLAGALAAWAALRIAREQPEWTTDSPAALAIARRGLDAERKFYRREAREHYQAALELDPGFAAARLGLLRTTEWKPDQLAGLAAELEAIDRSGLTDRERFLVEHMLADARRDEREGQRLVAEFRAAHPDDPYGLELEAEHHWRNRRLAEAEEVYERLLALDPNWVTAQNRLGYVAMAQGRFALAEDRFRTYRYVAPDQANPHDSLGELLVLTGRWDEARQELEQALRIRPDFCASYFNLLEIALYTGDFAAGERILRRAEEAGGCAAPEVARRRCRFTLWRQLAAGDHAGLVAGYGEGCNADAPVSPWVPQLAALLLGDLSTARRIEARVAEQVGAAGRDGDRSALDHLEGMRLLAEGKPAAAAQRLAKADAALTYFPLTAGTFKLYNRLQWARAAELAGDPARAAQLVEEVAAVNPALAGSYRDGRVPFPSPPPAAAARPDGTNASR